MNTKLIGQVVIFLSILAALVMFGAAGHIISDSFDFTIPNQ